MNPNLPISVSKWLQENQTFFKPPVCNKLIYNDQLKVFYVGGPNQRTDYHVELGEEFFYMLKGDMQLNVIERGQPKSIIIREGEAFLLPARIPHSPQRFPNTIGLVIERDRSPNELDALRYYVSDEQRDHNNCSTIDRNCILFERWLHCTDLGTQLAPIMKQFFDSDLFKTGIPSNDSCLIEAPYADDVTTVTMAPINLSKWLKCAVEEIESVGWKALFDDDDDDRRQQWTTSSCYRYKTKVKIFGGDFKHRFEPDPHGETYFWQLAIKSQLEIDNTLMMLENGHSVIAPPNSKICLKTQSGGFTLVVSMSHSGQ
ncbi:hypothetical protein BLOT_004761 [Blomia tropicalis]|nr:hypothetical protein BLOT_004761 [Blomia tropicalis]